MRVSAVLCLCALSIGCDALFPPPDVDDDGDGYVASEDCNDAAASVNPGAKEACDDGAVDEDCDGLINDQDEDVAGTRPGYADADDDEYGDDDTRIDACDLPSGYVGEGDDCNDNDERINPDATEVCDALDVDEDCDGDADDEDDSVDEATFLTF